ncbi:Translation initiation factor IF-2 OS=Streptomyces fumanus OX=67302 GN=GCM10018772_08070 PE=4 SV=1 [Streptomyces fumanus]
MVRGRSNLVGGRFDDGCSVSEAQPGTVPWGKCVRVSDWQKDAQPEWSESASETRVLPEFEAISETADESGAPHISGPSDSSGPSGPSPRADGPETIRTEILRFRRGAHADRDATDAFRRGAPVASGATDPFRPPARPDATDVPPAAVTDVLPAAVDPATDVLPAVPGPRTPLVRDPWAAPGEDPHAHDAHAHDPHEVTVQLDAVQLGDGGLQRVPGGAGRVPAVSDRPVFVDESGRRGRLYRRIGIAVGLTCAVYAVVMVVTLLSGSSTAPWMPVPAEREGKPAGQVETSPAPTESAAPSGTGTADPATGPGTAAGPTPPPAEDTPAAGTAPAAVRPDTTADPEPTATRTSTRPGGAAAEPDPTATAGESGTGTTGPATPPAAGDPTADPTGTAGPGEDDETGDLLQRPAGPAPVAWDGVPATPPVQSVEHTL